MRYIVSDNMTNLEIVYVRRARPVINFAALTAVGESVHCRKYGR